MYNRYFYKKYIFFNIFLFKKLYSFLYLLEELVKMEYLAGHRKMEVYARIHQA